MPSEDEIFWLIIFYLALIGAVTCWEPKTNYKKENDK